MKVIKWRETTAKHPKAGITERDDLLTYQGTHAASWAIFIDNPELGMYLERIKYDIDVLGVVLLELLQDLDLMHRDLDAFILC